jgi:RimJ/RimL family protein N-acetyltransferase
MKNGVLLRDTTEDDLPILFEQQLDLDANYMAAFTSRDPTDKDAFTAHWAKILSDHTKINKTILFNEQVAGYVACFEQFGESEISYWIGKEYWGRGWPPKHCQIS